jgi:DNA-binding IclR family transcriptional regulator
MSNPEIKTKILKFLSQNYPKDFTISEIVEEVKYHRTTVSKYVEVLKAEGKIVITRNFGKINLYTIVK